MISENQKLIIEEQLGRPPRGCVEVSYTQQNIPVVLQMRSLVDDEPFPTLYWLCSRDLYRAVARLETEGWVKRLEDEISADQDLRESYHHCHQRYVQRRWQLMTAEDRQRIEALGFTALFERYGIGGIARWDKVRCLHMHVADYLCTPEGEPANLIGARVDAELNIKELALRL